MNWALRYWGISGNKDLQIASRHLGLCMPGELEDLQGQIRMTAERLRETADISKLLQIAEEAELLEEETVVEDSVETSEAIRPRIAVARDEAFCFYYEENLRLLEQAGAEPVYFPRCMTETYRKTFTDCYWAVDIRNCMPDS